MQNPNTALDYAKIGHRIKVSRKEENLMIRLMPELPIGFSESHWNALVDHVTVYADDRMVFSFKNGSEITENF